MSKTRIDDMLIEMISPKLKEIEEKFAQGKGLEQEDINTLLLKSQYNHINHLDEKLDEVTESVVKLESKFNDKFQGLESRFQGLESRFQGLESKFQGLESKFELFKSDLESKFDLLRSDIEITIQKSLNRNMMLLVVVLGAFMALFKMMDKLL